jgi:hypothetical protein
MFFNLNKIFNFEQATRQLNYFRNIASNFLNNDYLQQWFQPAESNKPQQIPVVLPFNPLQSFFGGQFYKDKSVLPLTPDKDIGTSTLNLNTEISLPEGVKEEDVKRLIESLHTLIQKGFEEWIRNLRDQS